jgi:peroxiredoxin
MKYALCIVALAGLLTVGLVASSRADAKKSEAHKPPKIGQPVPSFTLENQDGRKFSDTDFNGQILVIEWINADCPFVQRHYKAGTMKNLAKKYADKGVKWVAIATGKSAQSKNLPTFIADHEILYPVLKDTDASVGKAFAATNTPQMFIRGKDGKLLYMGAIDDDPQGKKGDKAVNYVDKALSEITQDKPVTTPETKPYGCHVAYE